jgi:hypothetical protein
MARRSLISLRNASSVVDCPVVCYRRNLAAAGLRTYHRVPFGRGLEAFAAATTNQDATAGTSPPALQLVLPISWELSMDETIAKSVAVHAGAGVGGFLLASIAGTTRSYTSRN